MAKQKLFIGLLGDSGAGKTYTWEMIFNTSIKSNKSLLRLNFETHKFCDVFLINQPSQNQLQNISDLVEKQDCDIVFCSIPMQIQSKELLSYFIENNYRVFIHYLSPGYNEDPMGLLFSDNSLLDYIYEQSNIMYGKRNGQLIAEDRVTELKEYVYDWALRHELIKKEEDPESDTVSFKLLG